MKDFGFSDSTSLFSFETSSEQEAVKLKMQFVQRNYTGVYQCEVSFDNETLIATGYVYVQGTFCVVAS